MDSRKVIDRFSPIIPDLNRTLGVTILIFLFLYFVSKAHVLFLFHVFKYFDHIYMEAKHICKGTACMQFPERPQEVRVFPELEL